MKKYQILFLFIGAVLMSGCFGEDLSGLQQRVEANKISLVDLGLSVKWADRNLLGSELRDSYGEYYELAYMGKYPQYNDVICTSYDPAFTFDNKLRLPSKDEWEELRNKCTWVFVNKDSLIGIRVTGPNGNSIFIPLFFDAENANYFDCFWTGTFAKSYNDNDMEDGYYQACINYASGNLSFNIQDYPANSAGSVRPVQNK